jgi:hypothetical protein
MPKNKKKLTFYFRIKSLLDLFAILLFIVGNYLAFSSSSCARQAPTLFYTVLAWILLGYMIVLVPVFICASVIFCLPCVLGKYGSFLYIPITTLKYKIHTHKPSHHHLCSCNKNIQC